MADSLRDPSASLVPGLALATVGTAIAAVIGGAVEPVSTLVCAVVVGAVIGNLGLAPPAAVPGLAFAATHLLRAGVVLLGLRLSLGDVGDLGGPSLVVVAVTVTATFFGTQWLGRRLGLSRDLSLLVATGFSICGASAVAAVESSTEAKEEEVAAAIGLVTLFGSLAILVLPLLQGLLGLTETGFGTWVGASVHDVAQVVATASTGGSAVVAVAVVVKLTRVILLAPIVAGVNLHRRKGVRSTGGTRPAVLPLFVVGFLAMIALRTTGVLPTGVITLAKSLEGWLLAAALVGLGSNVRVGKLRRLGPQPLVLGALAWVLVAVASYGGVLMTQ